MTLADYFAGCLTVFILAAFWVVPFRPDHSYGWDESMHAALPAARIAVETLAAGPPGGLQVVVEDCQRYPPVVPFVLAPLQLFVGQSEFLSRAALRLLYCLGLFGVFLLAGEVVRSLRDSESAPGWPKEATARRFVFGALAFGVLCPLAFAFSGTLFLEVPFLTALVFCLRAWLLRSRPHERHKHEIISDVKAGLFLVLCFFTKFNYACLLFGALLVDLGFQTASALRRKRLAVTLFRFAWLATPMVLALAWWFYWPWPGDGDLAAEHRENFISFLQGNRSGYVTPWSRRILDWCAAFVPTARFGLLLLVGVLLSLRWVRDPAVRVLWLVTLALGIPISLHPFHLERFLIPLGPGIWILGALGLAGLAEQFALSAPSRLMRWGIGLLVLAACLVAPERDARFVAKRVGIWNEEQADYLTWLFASWRDLSPTRRLPTAGLRTETAARMIDLIGEEVTPTERIGWIGISTEFSPAALQLGLLPYGRFPDSFRRDADRQLFLDFRGEDPGWKPTLFRNWAAQFEVIFCTDPPDLKGRASRAWTAGYVDRLRDELEWSRRELGTISIERPLNEPIVVTLFACRPPL